MNLRAEIIAVGTELLLGQIVNTNAQYIAQECAALGIDVYYQTVVGDNPGRIRDALSAAAKRADLVICTGGLGPTQDDITKDVLAESLGRKLEIHAPALAKIENIFKSRGWNMVESNRRQAIIIEGCDPLPNDNGLAVGVGMEYEGIRYILLPGPPSEMRVMFDKYAKPWLQTALGNTMPLYSKMLKFAGIGESELENRLIDLIEKQSDPTLAPYAKEGEVTLRLTTRAATQAEANAKMSGMEKEIQSRLGRHIFAEEDVTLEEAIVRLLQERGATLSAAESCTGGLFAERVTSVPGSSSIFKGGIICYTNETKRGLLQVPERLLEGPDAPGAISAETAAALAEQMRSLSGTDFAVSFTGVAGPDLSEGKPVGLVYIGLAERGKDTVAEQLHLTGNRDGIRIRAVKSALYRLWQRLQK